MIAAIGVWLYTFGSSSVQNSFDTVVSVDGLLFALFYAMTGIATAVYFRKLARRSAWSFVLVALFPIAAAAFLVYIIYRSVAGLGGWSGSDLVSAIRDAGDRRGDHALRAVLGPLGLLRPVKGTYEPESELVAVRGSLVNGDPESDSRDQE